MAEQQYPECEKLNEHRPQMEVIREFLEWASGNGMEFGTWEPGLLGQVYDNFNPVNQSIDQYLALYFEIDMVKVEEERRAMLANLNTSNQSVTVGALWAKAFGSDYFDSLERKDQLIGLLGLWEDVSYRNDMMPSFILHQFTIAADEPEPVSLKLWCGFNEADQSFIANVCLTDEDGSWLSDLGSVIDLLVLLGAEASRVEQPSEDALIDALLAYSQVSITHEQEHRLYRQCSELLSTVEPCQKG
jgi:hypothetical protein